MTQKKQPSGGRRLTDAGRRPVLLGLQPEDYDKLRAAADVERRPLTQFLIYHGLVVAENVLKKKT